MAIVTVTLTGVAAGGNAVEWQPTQGNYVNIGTAVTGGVQAYLARLILPRIANRNVELELAANQMTPSNTAGPDFSDQLEASGSITVVASDNSSLVISGIGDSTDPYSWAPSNIAAVRTFANGVAGLADKTLSVTLNDGLNAPVIGAVTATPMIIDHAGTSALDATATDPDGQALTYQWTSDAGGTFSAPTAATTNWTAPSSMTAAFVATLTVTVSDGTLMAVSTVQVTVRAMAAPPLALPDPSDMTGATGDVVNVQLDAATNGRAPYAYSMTGLPPELGNVGRRIQGQLITSGTYTVTVTVTDANGDTASQMFTWTVTGDDIPPPAGINVRIDWGQASFSNPNADVTGRVVSGIECYRGKATSSILGRSRAGKLTFDLRNHDGLFDQENTSSALSGLVRPGIPVQLRHGSTPLWTGVLDSIPTVYDDRNGEHRARVTAFGIYSTLPDFSALDGSLVPETTALAMCGLLEAAGICGTTSGSYYSMPHWWEVGTLLEAVRRIEDTEGGLVYEERGGTIGFQNAGHRAAQAASRTFTGVTALAGETSIIGRAQREIAVKDVRNRIVGQVRTHQRKTGQTVFELGEPVVVGEGQTVDVLFDYAADSAIESVDAIDTGDWTANTMPDGSGTDRSARLSLTASLNDFNEVRVRVTYADVGGEATLYLTSLAVTATVLEAQQPLKVTRSDATSISDYKARTLTLAETWAENIAVMGSRLDAILAALKDPETRVTFQWLVTDWSEFASLEISDRVRLKMPGYEVDAFIEGIGLSIPNSGENPICTLRTTEA